MNTTWRGFVRCFSLVGLLLITGCAVPAPVIGLMTSAGGSIATQSKFSVTTKSIKFLEAKVKEMTIHYRNHTH
jgi:hypothetical protein